MSDGLVVLGASYAGVQIAVSARESGYDGPIAIIGDEAELPYQRPPLSKGYLSGKVDDAALPLRSAGYYEEHRIRLHLGTAATAVDRRGRAVVMADGTEHRFDRLAFATGSRARTLPLPGSDLDGVYTLRSLADARRLLAAMGSAERAVVVGGGYIGLEVASTLVTAGCQVTVLEASDRLLSRAAAPPLAAFVTEVHRGRGVEIVTGVQATRLIGEEGRVTAVESTDHVSRPADLVLVAAGAIPNGELAVAAGLACDQTAIITDACGRTNEPEVLAAGDCAATRQGAAVLRLESIQNATDQGRAAGKVVAGRAEEHPVVPWFWSDQYELKLQMAGLVAGYDRHVIRGRADSGRFGIYYFRDGRLIAVDTVNKPGDHLTARKLVASPAGITPEAAGDESVDLRSFLKAQQAAI
ncbi:NAD(P)/FAD-dependent oxidoreductase [Roseomonas populi]|uniref:FAD-dependent oxidoreductase n=1 Tax=Roseomonas populi TaxID=3121582 RepID=A0ABT1X0B9_9PROT|nr:FAD-dependent oxidoreductase [Roseomonas pecuniae]MCR0981174.1 FAD-dependent oxidoreductase [Roseomonas pecuniae]